jgi:hypothetical protein
MIMMMSFAVNSYPSPYTSQMSYNAPADDSGYMNNANSYSSSNSYSTSSGNINGEPFSYSSGYDGGSPFSSFSNQFGSAFGGQSGFLQGSINNSGPVFSPVFGNGNTTYARSGDAYSNQTATSAPPPMFSGGYAQMPSYSNMQADCTSYCPPYIPMDYQEQPTVCYPPTNHYQQDYNCYQQTPIHFPPMPTYGYTQNPNIPCPPEMAPAPLFPDYPTPMNMPGLGRQITPFGRPEEMKYPPAPHFPEMRPPSEPPKAPTFYCPPPPTSDGYGLQQPVYDYPPARPNY